MRLKIVNSFDYGDIKLKYNYTMYVYSTVDGRAIECRKSDIRRRALRMSNIRHSTMRPIESKKSDPTNKANQIEFSTFDPTECTRLVPMHTIREITRLATMLAGLIAPRLRSPASIVACHAITLIVCIGT